MAYGSLRELLHVSVLPDALFQAVGQSLYRWNAEASNVEAVRTTIWFIPFYEPCSSFEF